MLRSWNLFQDYDHDFSDHGIEKEQDNGTDGTPRKIRLISAALSISILLIDSVSLISSAIYFYENVLNDKNYSISSLFCILQLSGFGSTLYNLIVAYIIRDKIQNIFIRVQEIYDGMYIQILHV